MAVQTATAAWIGDTVGRQYRAETTFDRNGCWALSRIDWHGRYATCHLDKAREGAVVFRGEIDDAGALSRALGRSPDTPPAVLLGDVWRRQGTAGLSSLRGDFSAGIVDDGEQRISLVSDPFGSYPLYWLRDGTTLFFASSLRALLRLASRRPTLDLRAVADYLAFGFVTGTRSLAAGVSLVEPGAVTWWGPEDEAPHVDRYKPTVAFYERRARTRESYVSDVVDAFGASVLRSARPPAPTGMSLSGGLDSRAILSALGPDRTAVHSYTLGAPGCADEVIARRLAALAGTSHSFFPLEDRYLSGFLGHMRRMVGLTDGMYLSHGLTEMLALEFLGDPAFGVLLRGHCGELAKTSLAWPTHTDPRVYELETTASLVEHLLRRHRDIAGGVDWAAAFTESWRATMDGAPRASLEETLGGVPLTPPELCSYLYLREQYRRFTVPSLELFRSVVPVRLPFLEQDFLTAVLGGPPEWRDSTALHRAIIERYDPRLLRVRDSNTGARVDAGRLMALFGDKLNAVLKRLDVPGYRHYHSFDRWVARMLVEAVESELLSERSLGRGALSRAGVRELLSGARRGAPGCAYVLQVLLILELWQQENVDAWSENASAATKVRISENFTDWRRERAGAADPK